MLPSIIGGRIEFYDNFQVPGEEHHGYGITIDAGVNSSIRFNFNYSLEKNRDLEIELLEEGIRDNAFTDEEKLVVIEVLEYCKKIIEEAPLIDFQITFGKQNLNAGKKRPNGSPVRGNFKDRFETWAILFPQENSAPLVDLFFGSDHFEFHNNWKQHASHAKMRYFHWI